MTTWSDAASEVVRRVLEGMPPEASYAEKRRALLAAYPFGERAMHPYKVWLATIKRMLPRTPPQLNRVRFVLDKHWHLAIRCDWCGQQRRVRGCMLCMGQQGILNGLLTNSHYRGLVSAANEGDELAQGMLRDWLEERGIVFEKA